MLSGAKRNRNISDFSGRLGFLASLGMTLGICEIFNAQALIYQVIAVYLRVPVAQTATANKKSRCSRLRASLELNKKIKTLIKQDSLSF